MSNAIKLKVITARAAEQLQNFYLTNKFGQLFEPLRILRELFCN